MAPKLYMTPSSPSVRAVLMTAKAINIELELVELDFLKFDHLKSEYVKINPAHTIPTMDDNGFILCDSHVIMGYLVGKYSKDKSLYPEDVEKRALIDQRLFFDSGVLFARHLRTALSIVLHGAKEVTEKQIQDMNELYGFIEAFLHNNTYMAGNNLTIADFSIFTSITNSTVLVPLNEDKYPKISAWYKTMQALPYSDINQVGGDMFRSLIESKLRE